MSANCVRVGTCHRAISELVCTREHATEHAHGNSLSQIHSCTAYWPKRVRHGSRFHGCPASHGKFSTEEFLPMPISSRVPFRLAYSMPVGLRLAACKRDRPTIPEGHCKAHRDVLHSDALWLLAMAYPAICQGRSGLTNVRLFPGEFAL